jgi:cytochrome b pre-mRNA-processing protein 3
MLGFLFRGLTAERPTGAPLFDALTGLARQPHWYVEGKVPDTLDGRFAVLTTVVALVLVRLEDEGEDGDRLSVALTERFIHVMESEHRELGLGDPTLGKTVRKLVAMLAHKVELWREADAGRIEWSDATRQSLYKSDAVADAIRHSAEALREVNASAAATPIGRLAEGSIE